MPSTGCGIDSRKYLNLFLGQLGAKITVAKNAFDGL